MDKYELYESLNIFFPQNFIKILKVFTPPLKREREKYLNKVKETVQRCQPKIEERTGVDLGEVKVKDSQYIFNDMFLNPEFCLDYGLPRHLFDPQGEQEIILNCAAMSIIEGFRLIFGQFVEGAYLRCNSTIYIPFTFWTRGQRITNELFGVDFTDCTVVHELSHALWYAIDRENAGVSNRDKRIWEESFAMYGQNKWFWDFYNDGQLVKRPNDYGKKYDRGVKKIEQLVKEHGEEVLLRIPREWKELNQQPSTH